MSKRIPPRNNTGGDNSSQSGGSNLGLILSDSMSSSDDGAPNQPVDPVQPSALQFLRGLENPPLQYSNPYGRFGLGVFGGAPQPSGTAKSYVDLTARELEEELNMKATILLIGDQQMLRTFPVNSVLPQLLSVLQVLGGERERMSSLILCSRILAQVLENVPKAVQFALNLPNNRTVNALKQVLEKQMTYSMELFEEILKCFHYIFRQDISPILREKKIITDLKQCMERTSLPTHIHKLFYEILSDIFRKLDTVVLRDLKVDPCRLISLPSRIEEGLDPQIARKYLRCFGYLVERVPVYVSSRLDTFLKVLKIFFSDERYQETVLKLYIQLACHPRMDITCMITLVEPEFLEILRHLMVTNITELDTVTYFLQNLLFSRSGSGKVKRKLHYQWFWEDDFQNFSPYDPTSNAIIEEGYQKYKVKKYRSSMFSKKKVSTSSSSSKNKKKSSSVSGVYNTMTMNIHGQSYKINFDEWKQINSRSLVPRNIDREPFFTSISREVKKNGTSSSSTSSSSRKKSYNFSRKSHHSSSKHSRRRDRSSGRRSGGRRSGSSRSSSHNNEKKENVHHHHHHVMSQKDRKSVGRKLGMVFRSRLMDEIFSETMSHPDHAVLEDIETLLQDFVTVLPYSMLKVRTPLIMTYLRNMVGKNVPILPFLDALVVAENEDGSVQEEDFDTEDEDEEEDEGEEEGEEEERKKKIRNERLRCQHFRRLFVKYGLIYLLRQKKKERWLKRNKNWINEYEREFSLPQHIIGHLNSGEFDKITVKVFKSLTPFELLSKSKFLSTLFRASVESVEGGIGFRGKSLNMSDFEDGKKIHSKPIKFLRTHSCEWIQIVIEKLHEIFNSLADLVSLSDFAKKTNSSLLKRIRPSMFRQPIRMSVENHNFTCDPLLPAQKLKEYLVSHYKRKKLEEDPAAMMMMLGGEGERKEGEGEEVGEEEEEEENEDSGGGGFQMSDLDKKVDEWKIFLNGFSLDPEWGPETVYELCSLILLKNKASSTSTSGSSSSGSSSLSLTSSRSSTRRNVTNVWQNPFKFLVYSPSETKYDLQSIVMTPEVQTSTGFADRLYKSVNLRRKGKKKVKIYSTTTTTTTSKKKRSKRKRRVASSSSSTSSSSSLSSSPPPAPSDLEKRVKESSEGSNNDININQNLGMKISPFFSEESMQNSEIRKEADSFHSKKVIRYLLTVLEHCHFWLVDSLDVLKGKFREMGKPLLTDPLPQIFFNQHLSLRMLSAFMTPISSFDPYYSSYISKHHHHSEQRGRGRRRGRSIPRRGMGVGDGKMNISVAILTGCIPPWIREVLLKYPFLVSFEVRYKIFHFFPEKAFRGVQADCSATPELISGVFKDTSYKVQERSGILIEADQVMERSAGNRSLLKFEYEGEPGIGLGPSLEFYSLVAQAFQRRNIGLWVDISSSEEMEETTHVRTLDGLFPNQPIRNDRFRYYRFLGRLLSKNVYDERNNIDLPFSDSFVRYFILGKSNRLVNIEKDVDPMLCRSIRQIEKMGSEQDILDLEIYFEYKGMELTDEGEDLQVTLDNRDEYICLLKDFLLDSEGLQESREYFIEGLKCIIPLWKWRLFSSRELSEFHFHNNDNSKFWEWEEETLLDNLELTSGYTKSSEQVLWLVSVICKRFDQEEKKQFLEFVTGSRTLPVGGFSKMRPKLSVVQIVKTDTLDQNQILPTANTCFRKLKLPLYSNSAILLKNLRVAIKFGRGGFQLT